MNERGQQFYELEEVVQASMNGVVCGVCGHTIHTVRHIKGLEKP